MLGHRLMAHSLLYTGDIAASRKHYEQAIALYDPAKHRSLLAMRFGHESRTATAGHRSLALWLLGYPEAALSDANRTLKDARDIGNAATLMHALTIVSRTHAYCGDYDTANAQVGELIALADRTGSLFWRRAAATRQGVLFAMTGKAVHAVEMITSAVAEHRSGGVKLSMPSALSMLARAHAEMGQHEKAWHSIGEAITAVETHKERIWEAEVHRIAGDITLMSPERDEVKAEAYFEGALAIARKQQAKSWELRAAMSMARLWLDQHKRQQAHDLLAPIYGWFTEGFDTLDLKEAKALLEQLKA
jgi:predicted ATPase